MTSETQKRDRVSDWDLERLHRGELGAEQAAAVRARLARQGDEGRLARLAASDREILAARPPAGVAAEVRARLAAARMPARATSTSAWLWIPLAAAGVAALAIFAGRPAPWDETRPETITLKGDPLAPELRLYRKAGNAPERLDGKTRARPGDAVQIRYLAAGQAFGVIASVDARGAVTLHQPEAPGKAAALERSGERALPHSFVLDDTPGFERFVFVTSSQPFDTSVVEAALKSGRSVPAPLSVWTFTLVKEKP